MTKLFRILLSAITLGAGIGFTLFWDDWWETAFSSKAFLHGDFTWLGTVVAATLAAIITAFIADGLHLTTRVAIEWRETSTRDRLPGDSFLLPVDFGGRAGDTYELIVTQQCKGWLARKVLKRVVDGSLSLHLSCDQPEVKLTKQQSAGGRQNGDEIVLPLRLPSGEGTWTWSEVSFIALETPTSFNVDFNAELVVEGKKGRWLRHLLIVDSSIKTITVTRRASA